jgi:putative restriction endonuclease
MKRVPWSRSDMIFALAAYLALEPKHRPSPPKEYVARVSLRMNRSIGSMTLRFANFASRDPLVQAQGGKGMTGGGVHVDEIWGEFCTETEQGNPLLKAIVLECHLG